MNIVFTAQSAMYKNNASQISPIFRTEEYKNAFIKGIKPVGLVENIKTTPLDSFSKKERKTVRMRTISPSPVP